MNTIPNEHIESLVRSAMELLSDPDGPTEAARRVRFVSLFLAIMSDGTVRDLLPLLHLIGERAQGLCAGGALDRDAILEVAGRTALTCLAADGVGSEEEIGARCLTLCVGLIQAAALLKKVPMGAVLPGLLEDLGCQVNQVRIAGTPKGGPN